jgi:hypothetical protein
MAKAKADTKKPKARKPQQSESARQDSQDQLEFDCLMQSPEQKQASIDASKFGWIVDRLEQLEGVLASGKKPAVGAVDMLYGLTGMLEVSKLREPDNLPDLTVAMKLEGRLPVLYFGICKLLDVAPSKVELGSDECSAKFAELIAAAMTGTAAVPSSGERIRRPRRESIPLWKRIFEYASKHPDRSQAQVARHCACSEGTVSTTLNSAERKEWAFGKLQAKAST